MYRKIKTILPNLFHIHYYRHQFNMGYNRYYQCRCGSRIVRSEEGGYTPVNELWLEGLD